jgi:hypothetical protein
MNCPNCSLPVEADAAFCGNCGHQLQPSAAAIQTDRVHEVPAYAVAQPYQHLGEPQALACLLLGVTGSVGALFVPILGISLGALGLVIGTLARTAPRRLIGSFGLITSAAAVLLGLVVWAYAVQNLKAQQTKAAQTASEVMTASELSTPCYTLDFTEKLNITNGPASCNMNAFNGPSLAASTDAYKVFASKSSVTDSKSFTTTAQRAIEQDIEANLPGFVIDEQRIGAFAGSPAYIVKASDKKNRVALVEAAVLRPVSSGENIFILVHATNGDSTDLSILEAQWQWK